MIILPIGTKSTLALKPMVTIGLIIANFALAILALPITYQTENDLLEVQRQRYANQMRLYLSERAVDTSRNNFLGISIEEALHDIETAEDYYDLEIAIARALTFADTDTYDFQSFEKELGERTVLHYTDSREGRADTFNEWKRLRAKEDELVGGHVVYALGLVPNKMNRIHTFITYLFIHGGIWHLLGNMLFLWVVGCLLEDSWGRMPFLAFYLAGGVVAGLAHCLQDVTSTTPLIGASGAIAAAMGAFTVRHFWTKSKFFYFFLFIIRPFWGTFQLPAFVFLPFWFIQQVALKYLTDFVGGSDVAYLAHIAGYAAGFIAACVFKLTDFEERFLSPRVQKRQVEEGVLKDPRFNKACELMDEGDTERAKALFTELIDERPGDLDTLQDISFMYREKGMLEEYSALAGRTLKDLLLKSRFEEASGLALDIISQNEWKEVNPKCLMRVGKWLTDQKQYGEAHDIYRSILWRNPSPQVSAKASIALARLLGCEMNNLKDALHVLGEARELSLDAEWMERISETETMIKESSSEKSMV